MAHDTTASRGRSRARTTLLALLLAAPLALSAAQATGLRAATNPTTETTGNDANTGADAGDTFATATPVTPKGRYEGRVEKSLGDPDDYYRFHVHKGGTVSVLVTFEAPMSDRIEILDPEGRPVDTGIAIEDVGVAISNAETAETTETNGVRLSVHHAIFEGDYRLHLTSQLRANIYTLCFMNCDEPQQAPIDMVFGGSLNQAHTSVLLVPPAHGDLGNPGGPTVTQYIDATLRGIRRWEGALKAFPRLPALCLPRQDRRRHRDLR